MSFPTLLIAGSDAESVSAIRERIPVGSYLVHTMFADADRLERLLHGIDFDVVLIDRGSRDSDALQPIVDAAKGVCVVITRGPEYRDTDERGCEVLNYPFEQDALLAALTRARRRRQERFYVFSMESAVLH